MKLSLKLPLVFTASLLLLLAAALFGISRLNSALDTYQTTVAHSFEHDRCPSTTRLHRGDSCPHGVQPPARQTLGRYRRIAHGGARGATGPAV